MSEDIGELIIIYDAEDEMAQESFPLHPLRFLMIFTLVKSTIPGKKNYPKIFIFRTFRVVFRIFLKSSKSDWTETFSRGFVPFLQTKKYTQIVKLDMCTFLFWSLIVKRINISALLQLSVVKLLMGFFRNPENFLFFHQMLRKTTTHTQWSFTLNTLLMSWIKFL